MFYKVLSFFLLTFFLIKHCKSDQLFKLREKRDSLTPPPLVYPLGGTLKLLVGYAIPISMPGRILVYSQNFQFQYSLPQNVTFFSEYFGTKASRRRRQTDIPAERFIFYRFLEEELRRRGAPGKDCIMRSVCETAETPLMDDGLVGEILHVLLTPDYGGSLGGLDEEYSQAAEVGRRGQDCFKAYPSCPKGFGILDHISKLFDHD